MTNGAACAGLEDGGSNAEPGYWRQMLEKGDYYISTAWAGHEPSPQEDYEALQLVR